VAGLLLASAGGLAHDAAPLLGRSALVVAIGASILGVTLAAVALTVARPREDPVGRRRAWVGAGLSTALLVALVALLWLGALGPLVVERSHASPGEPDPAATSRLETAGPSTLVPIAVRDDAGPAFARAERAAEALGWTTVARDADARRLELRAEGRSDVILEVRPSGAGSLIELRPVGDATLADDAGHLRAFADRLVRRGG
jgi:hypothetical protein